MTYVHAALRREVVERAGNRCEYCRLPAEVAFYPHEVDHVVAEKHGGTTDIGNLAFACWRCNRHKGTDLTSFDPQTRQFSPLFNPRTQVWTEHFAYEREMIIGLTSEGRITQWRSLPNPNDWQVSSQTARLLQHWRHYKSGRASQLRPPQIRFPRVQAYRVELSEEQLTAEFNEDSVLELTPDLIGPTTTSE